MTQLEHDVALLRRLFEPWLAASGDTLIWPPDESDRNAPFKREMIAKARQILAAGESALVGATFKVPQLDNSQPSAIEAALTSDPLKREFLELGMACKNVVQDLAREAALD